MFLCGSTGEICPSFLRADGSVSAWSLTPAAASRVPLETCRPLTVFLGLLLQPHWFPPATLLHPCCSLCLNAVPPFLHLTPSYPTPISACTSLPQRSFSSFLSFGSPRLLYSHSMVFFDPCVPTVINYESNYFLECLSH